MFVSATRITWQRCSALVSSCRSLWITDRADWGNAVSGGRAAGSPDDALARIQPLCDVLVTFRSVRSLVLLTPPPALNALLSTVTSIPSAATPVFPSLTHLCIDTQHNNAALHVEALRQLTALHVLTIRGHRMTRSVFRRLLTLPLRVLDLCECEYGWEAEEASTPPPASVSCPTLRVLNLPTRGYCEDGTQALLGPDMSVEAVDTLMLDDSWADELAHLGDCNMRASLTALDISGAHDLTISHLLGDNALPELAYLRIHQPGDHSQAGDVSQAVYSQLAWQYTGLLYHLHLDLHVFELQDCGWLLQAVFKSGVRLDTLSLSAGPDSFHELGAGKEHPALPALPALRRLKLGCVRTDEQLRVLLTACPNILHLEVDRHYARSKSTADIRSAGELCRELVTLKLDHIFRADTAVHASASALDLAVSAPSPLPHFPQHQALAIGGAYRELQRDDLYEQLSAVVSMFAAAAPCLRYFLFVDCFHSHDLLPAMRSLWRAQQLRSVFIGAVCVPARLLPFVDAARLSGSSAAATTALFRRPSACWTDYDGFEHTAESEQEEVERVVQRMRTQAYSRWEVSFRQERVEDGRSCRQAFFDELDRAVEEGGVLT